VSNEGSSFTIPLLWLIPLGLFAGFFGSMVDSLFGSLLQRSWVQISTGKATSRLPAVVESGVPIVVPRSLFGEDDIVKLAQQAFVAARKAEKEEQGKADEDISSETKAKVKDPSSLPSLDSDHTDNLVPPDSANSRTSNGTLRQRRGLSQDLAIKPPSTDEDEEEETTTTTATDKSLSSTDLQSPSSTADPSDSSSSLSVKEALKTVRLGRDADPRLFAVICGYDLVSNEFVNFLSGALTALLTYGCAAWAMTAATAGGEKVKAM
jgi:Integral membrane protein DUF92